MDTIKKRLLALSDSITMELPRVYGGLEGVIIEVSEQGFRYLSSEKERGFLKWRTVSDQTLLGLSKYIVDENVQDDLYIISLAHLRLKNYEEAYRALNKLITLDPKNYLKYRDYLSICETGYRLKFGPKFEEIFQQVDDHNSAGRKQDAMDLLMQFQKDFLTSELGQSYTERFKLIYHDVMRG
jgi:tetratricopeptide (TPR) repeat protein